MKKRKYIYSLKNKLLLGFLSLSSFVFAQPGPGDLGSPPDFDTGGGEMGGSAPIDGGMLLLVGFALLYLLFKYKKEIRLFYSKIYPSLRSVN